MTTTALSEDRFRELHRYVRLITPLPAVWLLLSILGVFLWRQELYDSISDYYGGPLRDVFVGGLMASGICMIAYKGRSRPEDYALNFAGVNTFFVALVPNSFQDQLDQTRALESAGETVVVSSADLLQNLQIAVGVFLVVATVFTVLDARLMRWTGFRADEQTRSANVLLTLSWVAELALVAVVVLMVLGAETVAGRPVFPVVHFAAAALLILNLSFACASHAFPARLRTQDDAPAAAPGDLRWFRTITVAMWAGILVGGIAIAADVPYAVFWTEVVEIGLFLVFWFRATPTDWGAVLRPDRSVIDLSEPVRRR